VGDNLKLDTPMGPLARPVLGLMDDTDPKRDHFYGSRVVQEILERRQRRFHRYHAESRADPAAVKQQIEKLTANQERALFTRIRSLENGFSV